MAASTKETNANDIEGKSDEMDSCGVFLRDMTNMTVLEDSAEDDFIVLQDGDITTETMALAQIKAIDESQPNNEKYNTFQPCRLSFESERPLCQIFDVNWERYIDMPILTSDVGVRAHNSLSIGLKKDKSIVSCKSVGELLQLSPLQLSNYKNMGKLSVERIFMALNQILHSDNETYYDEQTDISIPVSVDCKKHILAMLRDEEYDISDLNDFETSAFSEYASASEVIGKEMALDAATGKHVINEVMQMLYNFYKEPLKLYGLKTALEKNASSLPVEIKKLPVKPFMFAYHISNALEKSELGFSPDTSLTILDFVRFVLSAAEDTAAVLNNAISFVKWLHFDIAALCKPMRDHLEKQRENARFAFEQRLRGETLEAIGVNMGVTRERIRQVEKKIAANIASAYHAQRRKHDILAIIHALRSGDAVLRYDEIVSHIDETDARMIWYLAKRKYIDCDAYRYSLQANAIVFGKETEHIALAALINEIPVFIEKSEMPHHIAELINKYEIPEELVQMQIKTKYKRTGMFYHRSRLTGVFMCDYILRTRFPNGYKIADESDQKRFMTYIPEIFGNKYRMTARALETKVSEVGVLIDRGKYIHNSYINANKDIVDDVNSYIENSSRVVLTYTELFDTFAERFSGTQINNRYCLQGVLKLYGCPFIMRKDYITKEPDINLTAEFEHFVEQYGSKVHISILLDEFNGLTEINIGFFCQRLSNVVMLDDGYYMHASQLDISEDDCQEQREFLLTVCRDAPASSRMLCNEYMLRFTDFMIRNSIESHSYLFGVLQYMFKEEFFFSRPYISLSNDRDLTHRSVLLQHISDTDSIDIDDLTDICDKNEIHYLSLRSLFKSIEPDFIRVDETTLMRKDITGLDDDAVFDTAQQILEIVHAHGGYCASKNIDDFSRFPELDVPWNAYLLESAAALAGDLLTVLRINTSTIYSPVIVFIGDEYIGEDMNSLILRLLVNENRIEPFTSKESILVWLREQGLCNVKLPSFLETEGHLTYDENRILKVQGQGNTHTAIKNG
ncbi:MAG: hypothetical protein LBK57_07425 [Clostridiales Family XIII bacterium]|jgi:hypothetical protein|nr:hypothetical protein [Clostridiales Family XIII bacterium]